MTEDQTDYTAQVFERAKRLIQAGIWGMPEHRLDSWIGCFKNYSSELLAAFLLDNLCFRSKDQFFSLLDTLFCDLPDPVQAADLRLLPRLAKRPTVSPVDVLLVPVIGDAHPPTKSGPYVLRLAQRRFQIHSDWLAWPANLSKATGFKHVYFVDDFCGSGSQFEEFATCISLNQLHTHDPGICFTYLVAAAHESGLRHIKTLFPFVTIKTGETLNITNKVLSDENFKRFEVDGFKEVILQQYSALISKVGLPQKGKLKEGYGDLGLAYGFEHGTPNNTLPIFWLETEYWTPLLDR